MMDQLSVDAQMCFVTPSAVVEVVRLDPMKFGSQGPGYDGAMKQPMVNTFITMMRQRGINPSPTSFLDAVAEVEGWETIELPYRRRVMNAYCGFCNGLVVAGLCFMSGKILSCYWSKVKDCTGKADLIILRKDGVQVSVGLTMDSEEAKFFEARKRAKSARNGEKWPDVMLPLNKTVRRDKESNMAWYHAEDIEPIFSWVKGWEFPSSPKIAMG